MAIIKSSFLELFFVLLISYTAIPTTSNGFYYTTTSSIVFNMETNVLLREHMFILLYTCLKRKILPTKIKFFIKNYLT